MKMLIAVIAKNEFDYKEHFSGWRNIEVQFLYIYQSQQIRGKIFSGVVITPKSKCDHDPDKMKLYNECLRNVR